MINLCKYSNIFGAPDTGLHKIRIFNIAIFDTMLTIIVALIFYFIMNKIFYEKISFWVILLILFIMGILMHRLFCVRTTIDKLLF